ncbi:MAG: glycerophosphodiester phosphodiesterase family protein [Ignavibacteriaceae bacterium]
MNSSFLGKLSPPSVDKLVLKVLENQLDGLDVWAGNMIDEKFMQKIKSNRLMLYVWTVNDSEKAKKLKSIGVDGITTDRAQWLRENISSG